MKTLVYFYRKYCAKHRLLSFVITLPESCRASYDAEAALGAAYWRSPSHRSRSLAGISILDSADPLTFDPVSDYEALENVVTLGTKRNPRRLVRYQWERHIDKASAELL